MAMIPGEFNASQHENMRDFSCIPKGPYIGAIIKSDVVLTKKAKAAKDPSLGQILKMQAKVLQGKFKGKIIFIDLNLINPSPQTREIAEKELATICRACGFPGRVLNSDQLHGVPMKLTVDIDVQPNFPDKNYITMYEPAGGAANIPAETKGEDPGSSEVVKDEQPIEGELVESETPVAKKKKAPWD